MPDADGLRPRRAQPTDLPALARLLGQAWPEVDWPTRFRRQWFENPAWNAERALGWLHERDGTALSFFGSLPLPYRTRNRDGWASAATALYVYPDQRRRGWGEALVHAWLDQPGPDLWVNSTSNSASAGLFEKLGLRAYSRGAQLEGSLVVRPFRHARIAAARRLGSGSLAGWLSLPLAAMGAAALGVRRAPRLPRSAWTWEVIEQSDDLADLDEWWARERDRHGPTLRRDAGSLRWLYGEGPQAPLNKLLLGRDPGGRSRALGGFRMDRGTSQLRQVDLFGDLDDPQALPALIAAGARVARAAGLGAARFQVPAELAGGALGIDWAPCQGSVYYRFGAGVADEGVPHFTDLDGDRCVELFA